MHSLNEAYLSKITIVEEILKKLLYFIIISNIP